MLYLLLIQVDDADSVVAKLGHKQAIALEINCEMINTATDVAKRDFRHLIP